MLRWAAVFFAIALAAAFVGFSGAVPVGMGVAKIIFFVALIVAVVSLVMSLIR